MHVKIFDRTHTAPVARLNDEIVGLLAEATSSGHPLSLKMPHLDPSALEEVAACDSYLIAGILAGCADTPMEAFPLPHGVRKRDFQRKFCRKIHLSQDPFSFIQCLRQIDDSRLETCDGMRRYHDLLQKKRLQSDRGLAEGLKTAPVLHRYG
jgi:hypothetical protein